jgi:N-hydroxyarylamine O-acetyltransferase
MHLDAYLKRIHYGGSLEPSFATLRALHRVYLLSITYENLDIHLGQALVLDEDAIFEKIVYKGRGGWCFEMNGLSAGDSLASAFIRVKDCTKKGAGGCQKIRRALT